LIPHYFPAFFFLAGFFFFSFGSGFTFRIAATASLKLRGKREGDSDFSPPESSAKQELKKAPKPTGPGGYLFGTTSAAYFLGGALGFSFFFFFFSLFLPFFCSLFAMGNSFRKKTAGRFLSGKWVFSICP
jgi:hypothetical protein